MPWGGNADSGSGKDVILATGEGAVSVIRWSKESLRYVAWGCETGIKIMRSHIFLPGEKERLARDLGAINNGKSEWKRICTVERPDSVSEEMAGVIRARIEWVDRRELSEDDENTKAQTELERPGWEGGVEKVVIGWGATVWVMNIYSGDGAVEGGNMWGWGEIVHMYVRSSLVLPVIHRYDC